nr:ComF family protein [Pedobacter sp. ASV19]
MWSIINLFHDLAGLLFPRLCSSCSRPLLQAERVICLKCGYDLPYTDFHLFVDNPLARQFWGRVPIHGATALLYFNKGGKTQKMIHNLKYGQQTEIGLFLGRKMAERLLCTEYYQDIDLIIPVPLHPRKMRKRGYNQSQFLAEGIAEILGIQINNKTLIRKTATQSQTKKDRYTRFQNLQHVFKVVNKNAIQGKHILLVDDVVTTGATLESCAAELQKHDVKRLSIAAAAYVS